jgi:hypothetical protein
MKGDDIMKQARMLLATKSQALFLPAPSPSPGPVSMFPEFPKRENVIEEGIVPGHNIGFCIPKTYGVGALRSSCRLAKLGLR